MSKQLSTFVEQHPGFYQERVMLPLDEMVSREVDPGTGVPTVVRELFDFWQERRVCSLPAMESFDPYGAFTPEKFRWVSWINVADFDSLNFVLRSHPGQVFGDWSGKALREYHNAFHARSCALEYLTCKTSRHPFYHEINQTMGGVSRTYTRLLLPVADRKGRVSRLYYAVRYVSLKAAAC